MERQQLPTDQAFRLSARSAYRGYFLSEHDRRTMAAWEKFVAGDDEVQGVSSSVLLSWYRCRDLYGVDPRQESAPRAAGQGCSVLLHNSVFTQLGGIAAMLADRGDDCLATVTDGHGRILGSWGSGRTMRKALDSTLAPLFGWSEQAIGTNGMGTALRQTKPISVRGPEHWCEPLHDWYCLGVAIYDSVTQEPVAALNVSSWEHEVPVAPNELTEKTEIVRQELRIRARRDSTEVAQEFNRAGRHARGALIAIDVAGRVVAANERAQALLGQPSEERVLDPIECRRQANPELREIARRSAQRAQSKAEWVGGTDLGFLTGNRNQIFTITPVYSPDGVIGLLLSDSPSDAELDMIDDETTAPGIGTPLRRIPAVHGERILLLSPEEIRYAEAARHDVWLVTDRGRVRSTVHGIDNVERALIPFGFMRVHRSYIVNLERVREISDRGNGALTLSTNARPCDAIAVSRRYAIKLRLRLGI